MVYSKCRRGRILQTARIARSRFAGTEQIGYRYHKLAWTCRTDTMNEYLPLINLILNMLILPLIGILWSIRIELAKVDARLSTLLDTHERRLMRLESMQDTESRIGG